MDIFRQTLLVNNKQYTPSDKVTDNFDESPYQISYKKNIDVQRCFSVNSAEVSLLKGQRLGHTGVRGSVTTLSTSSYLIGVTALAVATSIGLPLPSRVGVGKTYIIKDEAGGATTTNITIRSEGEKLIDGASSTTLSTNYQVKRFYTDGSNWFTC